MSNAKGNKEQGVLTPHHGTPRSNPGIAVPQDFTIGAHSDLPGHGQHGTSEAEHKALLAEAHNLTGRNDQPATRPRPENAPAHKPGTPPWPARTRR